MKAIHFLFFFLTSGRVGTCFDSLKHLSAYVYLACQELCAGIDGLGVCNCHSDLGTTMYLLARLDRVFHEKLLCAVTNTKTVINFQTRVSSLHFLLCMV